MLLRARFLFIVNQPAQLTLQGSPNEVSSRFIQQQISRNHAAKGWRELLGVAKYR